MLSFFLSPKSPTPIFPYSCFYEGVFLPTHPLLPSCLEFPYTRKSIEPSQDQGPLLPLMLGRPCSAPYFDWKYGLLHVYSLVEFFFYNDSNLFLPNIFLDISNKNNSKFTHSILQFSNMDENNYNFKMSVYWKYKFN
jgi:hypothetical protein